jgi:uncharacterized protein YjiS (DUF1127 family)
MTDIAMEALNRGWKFGFATGVVAPLHLDLRERYRRWRQYRTMVAELRQYSAGQITELGIADADIESVAREATGH